MPDKVEVGDFAPTNPAVRLPPTESERQAAALESLKQEDDAARTKRRAAELQALTNTHLDNVKKSHARFPTRNIPFQKLTEQERRNWQQKRKDLDQANRAYHLAVRRVCAKHRAEDAALAQARVTREAA